MATQFSIKMYPPSALYTASDLRQIADAAFEAIDDLEARLSTWIPHSQISAINRGGAKGPVAVSPEIIRAVATAKELWESTGGAFDITVGPLLELWGFYEDEEGVPTSAEIQSALEKVGMDKVLIDRLESTVALQAQDMRLDFGGVGKGMALDIAGRILKEFGIKSALLHGGTSTIVALGAPPNREHWTVHMGNPYNLDDTLDTFALTDASYSFSGCTGNVREMNGRAYCHIIDPRTGMPVQGVLAVSAVAKTATESDALSTAFLVMGREGIKEYCQDRPEIGAVFVGTPLDGKPKPEHIGINLKRTSTND
jgi:thiamine biosynthesis lipoprotein